MSERVGIGIIGGGLMGKESASAFGRWLALQNAPVHPEIVAVADTNPAVLEWFKRIPAAHCLTTDYHELLAQPDVDIVYVAVPHHLHEQIYGDVLDAGKDLLAEKPFGIDLASAERIAKKSKDSGRFVRVSSEFPFFPGLQEAFRYLRETDIGDVLEIRAGFLHASDLDRSKPINWKRQIVTCGEIGVMGDLGMHVVHVPFRLGWIPKSVYAQLQNVITQRPDGRGGSAVSDTWDNATLHTNVEIKGQSVPMTLEMKRLAPGQMNSWSFEVLGTAGGVRFSTKEPKTLWIYMADRTQSWVRSDVGHKTAFETITGGIFEFGFPDALLQMWAAFLFERSGILDERFGCATIDEAVMSHRLFGAALDSHRRQVVVNL